MITALTIVAIVILIIWAILITFAVSHLLDVDQKRGDLADFRFTLADGDHDLAPVASLYHDPCGETVAVWHQCPS